MSDGASERPVTTSDPTALARAYTPTALPSVTARLLAFVAILIGGLCGGLIGYSVVELQCGAEDGTVRVDGREASSEAGGEASGDEGSGCGTASGVGGLVGAVVGAGGVAVVAVLVLRAMAEWRRELDVEDIPNPSP